MEKTYIQITSGRGPAECCRVVSIIVEKMLKEAKQQGIYAEVVERAMAFVQENWQNHNELERGNPVRVIKEGLDR